MPEAITAEAFTSRGVDAATASRMAAEFNALNGVRGENVSLPPSIAAPAPLPRPKLTPTPITPPTDAQRANAEIAQIRRDRLEGRIDDNAWRTEFELKLMQLSGIADAEAAYRNGTPADRAGMQYAQEVDHTQEAFEKSIAADMQPARTPLEYQIAGPSDWSAKHAHIGEDLREIFFNEGLSGTRGSRIAQEIQATDSALARSRQQGREDSDYCASELKKLQTAWGDDFPRRAAIVSGFIDGLLDRNPKLKAIYGEHSELFESARTMDELFQVAEYALRRSGGR